VVISLIVAASENYVIGKNNKLPWRLPADLKYFKNMTWAMPVVMGRKTFESMGKPLRGRNNIVVTRNKDWKAEGTHTVNSLDQAFLTASEFDAKEIFVIGGSEIFQSALPVADRIYLTLIHHNFEGDSFLPKNFTEGWKIRSNRDYDPDEKNAYALSFQVWEKK
jgi:dihydrofolate reductase